MMTKKHPLIIGVRFSKVGRIYHFNASNTPSIETGDAVVVETSRGVQLGQVVQILNDPEKPLKGHWKSIDRQATPPDMMLRQQWQYKEEKVVAKCQSKIAEMGLSGIKIVTAEYSFDGARLSILFSNQAEEKVNLKSLRKAIQNMYSHSKVEMRQIGPRDVAKILGGMGACGLEKRCCSKFLVEFCSISIRMAKEQCISLAPTEITGMCGRLRCCLIYEYEHYRDMRKKLPKRNKRVKTPLGQGKVVEVIPLRESVIVDVVDIGKREFQGNEITLLGEQEK